LNVVLTSQLWGYFADKKDLTAEQELAEDKKYFVDEHHLTMPIAVDVGQLVKDRRDSTKMVPDMDRIGKSLFAFAYPTFFLVDQNGVIKKRFLGFREDDVKAEIEKMLGKASKPATSPEPKDP
jgi:peroxiredoxin